MAGGIKDSNIHADALINPSKLAFDPALGSPSGKTFWVDGTNGDDLNSGTSLKRAVKTLDQAFSLVRANKGDVVLVVPWHAETIANAQITCDVAGVYVRGLGWGSHRPTITFNHANASIDVTAANVTLDNLRFHASITGVLIGIDIDSAYCTVRNCKFTESSDTTEFVQAIDAGVNTADNLLIEGCTFVYYSASSSGPDRAIALSGNTSPIIRNNYINGDFTEAAIECHTVAAIDVLIESNFITNMDTTEGAGIQLYASTTGQIYRNVVRSGYPIDSSKCVFQASCTGGDNFLTNFLGDITGTPPISAPSASSGGGGGGEAEWGRPGGGEVFYVDSGTGNSAYTGQTFLDPLATIDQAYAKCVASRGDIIYVLPGHTETLAADIAADKIGTSVIGLGIGTLRPTITMGGAGDAVVVSVADCTFDNLRFIAGASNVTTCFDVNAAGCQITNCEFTAKSDASRTLIICIDAAVAAADDLLVDGCQFIMAKGTGTQPTHAISLVGNDRVIIRNCYMNGDWSTGAIIAATTAVTDAQINNNEIINTNATIVGEPQTFYVHSVTGNDFNSGRSSQDPLATIDAGNNKCLANRGDTVIIMENHAESLGAAQITADIAGVTFQGLGSGDARPKITATNTAAQWDVTAANVTIENIHFYCNIDALVGWLDINSAGVTVRGCRFTNNTNTPPLVCIDAEVNTANQLTIEDCDFLVVQGSGTEPTECIVLSGNAETTIHNNYCRGVFTNGIVNAAVALIDMDVVGNKFMNEKAATREFDVATGSSGFEKANYGFQANSGPATYYVHSGGLSTNAGISPEFPLTTLDAAIGKCRANRGDIIYIMAGHAESLAAAQITADIIGINIIGLGNGANRPTFTGTNIAASLDVTAANVTIENLRFYSDIDALTAWIDVNAANCTIRNCEFTNNTDKPPAICIDAGVTTADDLIVEGCEAFLVTGGGTDPTHFLKLVGNDRVKVQNNYISGAFSTGAIIAGTTVVTSATFTNNIIINSETSILGTPQTFYVHSVSGSQYNAGTSRFNPMATIAQAEALCVTGRSDVVIVMEGHSETITGSPSLTLDTAGTKIIGEGGRTRKPQVLIDGANTAYVTITAADIVLQNITFKAGHADIAKALNVAAAGVEIRNCNFEENIATENFLIAILTTNAADDLVVDGCFITTVDGAETEAIKIVGACNRVAITNNYIKGAYTVSAISATTAACLDMQIGNNKIINTLAGDDLAGCIDLFAASTGIIYNNCLYMEDNTDCLTAVDGANCGRVNNLTANEYGEEAGAAAAVST